jgi:hypothetical protein
VKVEILLQLSFAQQVVLDTLVDVGVQVNEHACNVRLFPDGPMSVVIYI